MALQVWLPLNGNLNNQGLTNWQFTNNNATVDNSGKIGKCYAFSGSSQYLRLNQKVIDTSQFTISFWMYATDVSANHCIFSTRNVTSGAVNIYLLSAGIRFDTSTTANWQTSFKPSANTWYHITLVQDATTKYLYVNGVLNNSTAGTTDLTQVSSVCTIGCEHINGSSIGTYFAGKLNDFRIYSRALAPREIELLSRGLVCHYPLTGGRGGADNLLTNTADLTKWTKESGITTTWDSDKNMYKIVDSAHTSSRWGIYQDLDITPNTAYTISVDLAGTSCGVGLGFYESGSINYPADVITTTSTTRSRKTYTLTSGANSARCRVYLNTKPGTSTTAWFSLPKLEVGSIATPWMPNPADTAYTTMGYNSTTEYDVSGYGNNGTKNGTIAYLTDTPRYNVSTNIKGASSYIQIPNLTTTGFNNSYSFAWWGKVPSYQGYMMWGFSDGVRLNGIFNGNLWNTGDGTNNPLYIPGTTTQVTVPTVNVWHHWVMTGDGTTCKVYQDGVLWGQAKTYKPISGTTIYLNGWDAGTSYTYGDYQMSDFRIYATALSATQVAELYNTAVSVANNGTLMGYELVEG